MNDKIIDEFLNDRKIALEKFTKESITDYCKKYEIPLPKDEKEFWLGAHRARFHSQNVREDLRAESARWLEKNGYDVLF